jgi:UDP-N-acetyl-D-glucosamine dehydrogenase
MDLLTAAIDKLKNRTATVGLMGLGYAGLPLACVFSEAGFTTIGFDVDAAKVDALQAGQNYIDHIPARRTSALVEKKKLQPTTDFTRLAECDAAIICVPTPLGAGRAPDLTYVIKTARAVGQHLHRGQLVVLESTSYPGTTDEEVLNILNETGLKVGEDFYLAFSPEREDPGNEKFSTCTIPKLVGGVTPNCTEIAATTYEQVVEHVVRVSSARVAECAKLLENIYRCVNIALINELKLLFERMNIDVWEVIEAASTKPFGFTPFYPGPGLGGHCIPIDPFYLTWKARQYDFSTRFIELAGEINTSMPLYVVSRLTDGLNIQGKALRDANVLLIGAAYKKNIEDVRESPALSIIRELDRKLARVSYHDPHVPRLESRHLDREMTSVLLTPEALASSDAVVIVTDHAAIDYDMILTHASLVIDTRNATPPFRKEGQKAHVLRA